MPEPFAFISVLDEVAAAMARIASTGVIDENWMWDITCRARREHVAELDFICSSQNGEV